MTLQLLRLSTMAGARGAEQALHRRAALPPHREQRADARAETLPLPLPRHLPLPLSLAHALLNP